jgi:hypothetical protein
MPVILATQETEMRRIKVRSQPRQIVHEILSQKNLGLAQGVGLEFKPQYCKKKKKERKKRKKKEEMMDPYSLQV